MPGRSPSRAVSNFLEPIQRALSCVTRTPLIISPGGRHELGKVHTVTWEEAEPVRVRNPRDDILTLDVSIQYEILHIPHDRDRGPYKVSTRGYMHALQTIDGAEVMAFHWHPNGKGAGDTVRTPHTHMGSTQLNPAGVISKKHHIPGRRMSVEEVLRYCIEEIKVEPLRADWKMVLSDSEDLFRMWASWGADKQPGPPAEALNEEMDVALTRVMRSGIPDDAKKAIIIRVIAEWQRMRNPGHGHLLAKWVDELIAEAERLLREQSEDE